MIVREGFDGFSMQKLAKVAGVSPATLYIYFANKEDMINQLYNAVQRTFSAISLDDFNPEVPFAEGLAKQWRNRLVFIERYPHHFQFMEQFRNSPLVNHKAVEFSEFKEKMHRFMSNAVSRGELAPMEPELFWAMAYGPFYTLIKFHLNQKSIMDQSFELTPEKMQTTLRMVLKALRPD